MSRLSHLDEKGQASMVDVSEKPETARLAVAGGTVVMAPETLDLVLEGKTPKGDVLATARLAGIMAAKRTSDLIPLCHPLPLARVGVDFAPRADKAGIDITATAKVSGQTGVEMEALTAVSVAALTVYDMIKGVERGARIENIRL
ncbi:MAG: cyclic pyranopterin monophosphate synthase MoaC, partial [bacterium]